MTDRIVRLDVREDIRQGRHPFERIMNTVAELRPEQTLLLLAPFEPIPLYHALGRQGFTPNAREIGPGHWEVLFARKGCEPVHAPARALDAPQPCRCQSEAAPPGESTLLLEVDARGLEPPQPMVTILEAVAALPEGGELLARTDRRPLHLYLQLEQRGFIGETAAQADGSFITRIRRAQ